MLFDSSEQNSNSPVRHSVLNYFRCVHTKRQQMSSDSEIICSINPGGFIGLSTSEMSVSKYNRMSYSATASTASAE